MRAGLEKAFYASEDLTEIVVEAGHELMIEQADFVNAAIESWLRGKNLTTEGNDIT